MPVSLPPRRRSRAILTCGNTLYYDCAAFLPRVGERVPCVRHEFCRVETTRTGAEESSAARPVRAARRTVTELVQFVAARPESTVAELRRHRFTLRLIAAAVEDGLLHVESRDRDATVRPAEGRN